MYYKVYEKYLHQEHVNLKFKFKLNIICVLKLPITIKEKKKTFLHKPGVSDFTFEFIPAMIHLTTKD